jgi:hypothetical protein
MSHKYRFQADKNLLVIVFESKISPDEERQAVLDVLEDSQMKPNARILVEKSNARMTVTEADVMPQIELVRQDLAKFGRPKVATVVPADYDFGMVRMLEIRANGEIDHDFEVFRELDKACAWLGFEPSQIDWP